MGGATVTPGRLAVLAVSLVLIVIGFVIVVYGSIRKEAHAVSWGLLLPAYAYLALVAGGSLIFQGAHSILGYKGPRGELTRIVKLSLWFSIVSLAVAGIVILAELTRPLNAPLLILLGFNPASRLALDVPLITLFIVILALHLILMIRVASGGLEKVELALAIVGVIVAVAFYSNLAQVFGAMISVPGWYGAHLAPYFIVSAILLGAAGQTLFTIPYAWRDEELKGFLAQFYGGIMVLGVLLIAFLIAWNAITAWYRPEAWAAYSEIVAGAYSAIFWVIVVLLGIIAVLILALYAFFKRSASTLILAAALALISGFVNLSLLIIVPQTKLPEVLGGLYRVAPYNIASWEALIILGALIIWPSLYVFGQTLLPLLPGEKPRRLFIFK